MEGYKLLAKLDEDRLWQFENSDKYNNTEELRTYLLYEEYKNGPERRLDVDPSYYLLEYNLGDYLYWAHWNATENRLFKLCIYKKVKGDS